MIFGNQLINRQARVSQLPNIYKQQFSVATGNSRKLSQQTRDNRNSD